MDYLFTALRSLAAIAMLFAVARLMGKKQVSQLTFFDYVLGISVGSVAATAACERAVDLLDGIIAMAVFGMLAVLLALVSRKSYPARKLLEGMPTVLVQNGEILLDNLRQTGLTVNDLLEECRLKNAFYLKDIDYAILETNGELSVLLKPALQPLTPQDMRIAVTGRGVCTNVVVDGTVLEDHLALLGVDRPWLMAELLKLGFTDASELILCSIDGNRQLYAFGRGTATQATPLM